MTQSQVAATLDARAAARTIVVRLVLDGGGDPAVVIAALSMLLDGLADVHLVMVVEPHLLTEGTAMHIHDLGMAAPPAGRFLDADLMDAEEALGIEHLLDVTAGASPADDARAVVLLAALAETLDPAGAADPEPAPATAAPVGLTGLEGLPPLDRAQPGFERRIVARAARAEGELARAIRDRRRQASPRRRVGICVVSQQATSWGAVQTVCDAWRDDDRVELSVVALPGAGLDTHGASRLLTESGYLVHDASWVQENLDEIDVVVLEAPYDGFRPPGLHAQALAAAGVRLAYVPYGTNVGGGQVMQQWAFDLPLHQLAWRVYVRSEVQVSQFAEHCSVGGDHLRLLGTPKIDRVLRGTLGARGEQWRALAGNRRIVVWNPHYTVQAIDGLAWSTYHLHVGTMMDFFARRDDSVLVVRPHFQLFPTLRSMGEEGARLEARLRDAVSAHENILLDEASDYEDTFAVADVLVSDASSMLTEFMPTGRPVVYTPRPDGPGLSRDATYVDAAYRADSAYELKRDLTMLLGGKDPQQERRAASIARHFAREDGRAGARIADDVVLSCMREWGMTTTLS